MDAGKPVRLPLVLETKLWPPPVREGLLPREHLVTALGRSIARHRLTLVSAGAGFGKTSLLAAWFESCNDPETVAWVTLDSADNDPVRMWAHVAEGLRRTYPAGFARAAQTHEPSARAMWESLVNELATLRGGRVLVLDDFQLVTDPVGVGSLDSFVAAMPPRTRVVVSTRVDPAISLARLRTEGNLGELRDRDLAYTFAEAREAVERTPDVGLGPRQAEELRRRTEGWPAGIHLALLAASEADDPQALLGGLGGDMRMIADYLGAEVLAHLDDETRSFLVRTSMLDELTGSLCDAVLETTGSDVRLRELERAHLFVAPLDDRYRWFRYHQLFRDLLRAEFGRLDVGTRSALHRRASGWYASVGERPAAAIDHALSARDWEQAAALAELTAVDAVQKGRWATVLRWISALPERELLTRPLLPAIAGALSVAVGASWGDVERWQSCYGRSRREFPEGGSPEAEWFANLPRVQFVGTDVGAAVDAATRLLELSGREVRTIAHGNLAWVLYLHGQADRAREHATRAIEEASLWTRGALLGNAVLSLLATEAGDGRGLELAQEAIEAGADLDVPVTGLTARTHVALALALAFNGRLEQAEAQAEAALLAPGPSLDASRVRALIALSSIRRRRRRFSRARGAIDEAEQALRRFVDPGRLSQLLEDERRELDRAEAETGGVEELSKAELSVLRLLDGEMTLGEIAGELFLSHNTVKSHCRSIYRKLRSDSRADAVARARDLGLLPPEGLG